MATIRPNSAIAAAMVSRFAETCRLFGVGAGRIQLGAEVDLIIDRTPRDIGTFVEVQPTAQGDMSQFVALPAAGDIIITSGAERFVVESAYDDAGICIMVIRTDIHRATGL